MILEATNSLDEKATQNFIINVIGCSEKCSKCFDLSSNSCFGCNANYFLKVLTCVDSSEQCGTGNYGNTSTRLCTTCPAACTVCSGGDALT